MRLWLLRHAKSSWDAPDLADHERPLAPRGERDADLMANFIEGTYIRPALVLCSSGLRARQTLGRVLPSLGEALEIRVEPALYSFDPSPLLSRLRTVLDDVSSVMLVGHNPALQELALTLAEDGDAIEQVATKFPTCGLAEIELHLGSWRDVAPATGTLLRVTVPRDLA
jgi:phosphohistidine phosphatase